MEKFGEKRRPRRRGPMDEKFRLFPQRLLSRMPPKVSRYTFSFRKLGDFSTVSWPMFVLKEKFAPA